MILVDTSVRDNSWYRSLRIMLRFIRAAVFETNKNENA